MGSLLCAFEGRGYTELLERMGPRLRELDLAAKGARARYMRPHKLEALVRQNSLDVMS